MKSNLFWTKLNFSKETELVEGPKYFMLMKEQIPSNGIHHIKAAIGNVRTQLAHNVLRATCFLELGESVVVLWSFCYTLPTMSGNGAR
jgi:hypothetical protein